METLIKSMPRVFTADLTPIFGEKPRDTTSISAFFACDMRQIHRRIRRHIFNQCFLEDCEMCTARRVADGRRGVAALNSGKGVEHDLIEDSQ